MNAFLSHLNSRSSVSNLNRKKKNLFFYSRSLVFNNAMCCLGRVAERFRTDLDCIENFWVIDAAYPHILQGQMAS